MQQLGIAMNLATVLAVGNSAGRKTKLENGLHVLKVSGGGRVQNQMPV